MKNKFTFSILTFGLIFAIALPFLADAALYRTLKVGSRGADVSELQTILAENPSVYPQGLVTGYFGSLTRAAVIRFQTNHGLARDGIVGPITIAALQGGSGGGTVSGQMAPRFTALSVSNSTMTVNTGSNTVVRGTATINFSTVPSTLAAVHYSTSKVPATENESANPPTVSIGGTRVQSGSTLSQNHTVTLTDLSANTRYYYIIHVVDANGMPSVRFGQFVTGNF